MSKKLESIKKQIEALNRTTQGNLHDYDRRRQLIEFADSCIKISYRIAEDRSNATYQQASDSNSKIAEGLKPLKRDLEIMEDIIDELSRINREELSWVEEKLTLIGG